MIGSVLRWDLLGLFVLLFLNMQIGQLESGDGYPIATLINGFEYAQCLSEIREALTKAPCLQIDIAKGEENLTMSWTLSAGSQF